MGIKIRLIGGHADGQTRTIPDAYPPSLYSIPEPVSAADWDPVEAAQIQRADYQPVLRDGRHSRADGAYLYQRRNTPESRRAHRCQRPALA